jgi:transposase
VLADRAIPDHSSLWTAPGRAWLADLELPATPRGIIQDCCGLLDILATPIARLEREIYALAKPDPRVQALMALPGVGKLTAMTLVAEIGDIGRFPTARKLCAWAGLTPRCATPTAPSATATSPSRAHLGALDPAGGRPDRQAHPMFAGAYAQLARRRGNNIATTAIARRLLARSFHILTQLETAPTPEKAGTAPCSLAPSTGRPNRPGRACSDSRDPCQAVESNPARVARSGSLGATSSPRMSVELAHAVPKATVNASQA